MSPLERTREEHIPGSRMEKRSSAWLVIAPVTALAITVAAALVGPAMAQDASEIAYIGAGGSVWLTDSAGETTVQLAPAEGFASADWSPDGQRLALVKGNMPWEGGNEIYLVDAGGTDLTKVADGYAPVWLEDSQGILYVGNFVFTEEGTEQSVIVFTLLDRGTKTLAAQRWISGLWPIQAVSYSPRAQIIAVYVAGLEMEGHVVLLDREGRVLWDIEDYVYSADNFDWSPDGERIVYRDSGDPFIGGKEPALKIFKVEDQELIASLSEAGFWPRWSPDGEKIASFVAQEQGGFSVRIVSKDGAEVVEATGRIFGDIWNTRPLWSPDGTLLLFASVEGGSARVYTLDEGGGLHAIAEGLRPELSWSPDGTQVALSVGEEGSREIYVVKADGSGLHKIADGWAPQWRPQRPSEERSSRYCPLPIAGSLLALVLLVMVSPLTRSRHAMS
jgi:Tol biopolymer transport system component